MAKSMQVKTLVITVSDYETALAALDTAVNSFLGTYSDIHIVIESDNAIQDTLYPPISGRDLPRIARRVVYEVLSRY